MGVFSGTVGFLENYFYGGGIGWWFFFFLAALISAIYIFYSTSQRKLANSTFWKVAVLVAVVLLIPSVLFKFTVKLSDVAGYFVIKASIQHLEVYQDVIDWRVQVDAMRLELQELYPMLTGYIEPVVYLGVLGGVGALGLAIAFFINFKGAPSVADNGDDRIYQPPPPQYEMPVRRGERPLPAARDSRPQKPKANAWLVSKSDGRNYQINLGSTTIGRSTKCDIPVVNDATVSKTHAKIVEENGRYKLIDLGSTNHTKVNGRIVRQPILLQHNDEIQLADNTILKFIAS